MESFAYDIVETARAIRRDFDRRAAALGTTRAQWRVLARVSRQDGQRQLELAEALDVEPITLCRMVDRLAEAGLVESRSDESDRRAWRIHLTEKARPVIASLHELADDFHRVFASGVQVLFTPTTPTPAFPLGGIADPYAMYLNDIFTATANLAGVPAMSLPIGRVDGLPVGGQLLACHFDEAAMFGVAYALETALGAEAHR
jgi:Asp-tRNA(Asn)/Glu-tRNA(Gln) amidotransferase A subunit family amidase